MRRLALVGASVVVLSSGLFAEAAVAEPYGPSGCKFGGQFARPGDFISVEAQTIGLSDKHNPGNPHDPVDPDVKTFCNPSPFE